MNSLDNKNQDVSNIYGNEPGALKKMATNSKTQRREQKEAGGPNWR